MKLKIFFYSFVLLVTFSEISFAESPADKRFRDMTYRFSDNNFGRLGHTQGGKLPASNSPSQFPFLSDSSEDKKLSMRAQRIFNNNEGMNAFMIIKDGKIIYEGYKKI